MARGFRLDVTAAWAIMIARPMRNKRDAENGNLEPENREHVYSGDYSVHK